MTACLASLLELPIEEVPYFAGMGNEWHVPFFNFLNQYGYEYEGLIMPNRIGDMMNYEGVKGYVCVSGRSPRSHVKDGHMVIFKDGKLAHDPHPDGTGIDSIDNVWMIRKIQET